MPAAQPSSLASVAPARMRLAGLLGERLDRSLARLTRHPYSPVFVRSDVSFEMPRIFNGRDAAQLTAAQREDLERWRGEA